MFFGRSRFKHIVILSEAKDPLSASTLLEVEARSIARAFGPTLRMTL